MGKRSLIAAGDRPFVLEQVVGPGQGRVFEAREGMLSIGRSEENDVVIPSGAVSRVHACIEPCEEGYVIRDNGSKNGIQVNGSVTTESVLQDGDVVQVGDQVFRFNLSEPAQEENLVAVPGSQGVLNYGTKKKVKAPANRRPLIYAVVLIVLGAVYFMDEETEKPKSQSSKKEAFVGEAPSKLPTLKNLDTKSAQLPNSGAKGLEDPLKSRAEVALDKLDWNNPQVRESEQYFRRGRREYLSHNFQRAIQFFRAALSFNRSHKLALFYYQLSVAESERRAQKNMATAIRYFESLQYERAIYHFSQAVSAMAHRPKHELIPKATKYIKISKRRLRAAELFP